MTVLERNPPITRSILRNWRWAAVPFGVVYLILLAAQFRGIVTTANLDADAVSAPVIGELFGSAPASAHVVLGEFPWYATLLFELATKWLPAHRHVWEAAPYLMALAGFALTAWSVWLVAGAFAASLTAVLLVCAGAPTLHLLLSMTQHAPDWFCLGLLAAFVVGLERGATRIRPLLLVPICLLVGIVVGVNAASDTLLVIAGLVPFALAVVASQALSRTPHSRRVLAVSAATLAVIGLAWAGTAIAMSALHVGPEPGLNTSALASAGKIATNFRLWWHAVAVLGNGDFFGRNLSFTSGLAVACALLTLVAVVSLPRLGWRGLRRSDDSARLAFLVFWCSSAVLLTVAFMLSAVPVDIHADRYLVGVIYAAAAVIPAVAVRRASTRVAALLGTCVFALAGVVSLAQGVPTRQTEGFPSPPLARRVAAIAAEHHVRIGYAGYWDAAPITWADHFRPNVYPVSVCDQGAHLCPFDLHFISSWYSPRSGSRSFLLTDRRLQLVPAPTPGLGRPAGVYHVGRLTMYVYSYDIASRFAVR